jgi:hypothetical protein
VHLEFDFVGAPLVQSHKLCCAVGLKAFGLANVINFDPTKLIAQNDKMYMQTRFKVYVRRTFPHSIESTTLDGKSKWQDSPLN